jgi:hypothetical protein
MTQKEETKHEEDGAEYSAGAAVVVVESDDVEANGVEQEENDDKGDPVKEVSVVSADAPWLERYIEVIKTFWPLGLVAFGGPQAHVAILRDHLVRKINNQVRSGTRATL